jgi:hypothetical protein
VDLCLREGISLEEAVSQAIAEAAKFEQAGVGIKALEQVARTGLSNGAFEDSEEEAPAIVEEFYSDAVIEGTGQQVVVPKPTKLTDKLAGTITGKAA